MPCTFKRGTATITVPGSPEDHAALLAVELQIGRLEADSQAGLSFEGMHQNDIALTAAYAERRAIWLRLHD